MIDAQGTSIRDDERCLSRIGHYFALPPPTRVVHGGSGLGGDVHVAARVPQPVAHRHLARAFSCFRFGDDGSSRPCDIEGLFD
jgi:hypothetical protein